MSSATLSEFGIRRTITTKVFAKDTNANPVIRRGRPIERWVLVSGVKKLEVYKNTRGPVVVEGSEYAAYKRAQTVGKQAGVSLRAIPFSSALYAL